MDFEVTPMELIKMATLGVQSSYGSDASTVEPWNDALTSSTVMALIW